MTQAALSIDDLRAVVRGLPDNGLARVRDAALGRLDEQSLPTPRVEDWKYTDLAHAIDISNRWLQSGSDVAPATVHDDTAKAIESIDAIWLVIENGAVSEQYLSRAVDDGVDVKPLSAVPDAISGERPLDTLNAALLQDGLHIEIARPLPKPIGILILDRAVGGAQVSQGRVHLDVAEGCKADVIEYHVSSGDEDHYANSGLSISVARKRRAESCASAEPRYRSRADDTDEHHDGSRQLTADGRLRPGRRSDPQRSRD
jgi:Fe-S cluster assembly protein SufD